MELLRCYALALSHMLQCHSKNIMMRDIKPQNVRAGCPLASPCPASSTREHGLPACRLLASIASQLQARSCAAARHAPHDA